MKKAMNEKTGLNADKTPQNGRNCKMNHNAVKIVHVDLDTHNHRKMNSCSTSTKKIIVIPSINRPVSQRKECSKKTESCHHNKSNSIKEDIRKRNCRSLVKPIVNLPQRKLTTKHLQSHVSPIINCANSNCVLTTNFTENREDKGKKREALNSSMNSLKHLQKLFRTSNLKKTIIIDEKGNTNLFRTDANNNSRKNNRRKICESLKGYIPPLAHYAKNINTMNKCAHATREFKLTGNHPTSACNVPQSSNDRGDDYEALISLLNRNINQANCGSNGSLLKEANNCEGLLLSDSQKDIFTQKERDEIDGIEHNDNSKDNIETQTLLEACFQEEVFSSFIKYNSSDPHCLNLNDISFNYSTLLTNKNDNLTNYDQTECYTDEKGDIPDTVNTQPYLLNPRLLLKTAQLKKSKPLKEEPRQCAIF